MEKFYLNPDGSVWTVSDTVDRSGFVPKAQAARIEAKK
jgi:hypothetical protein